MKRIFFTIISIAILLVASTAVANCQAASTAKALVKVAEKGATRSVKPYISRIEIGKQLVIRNSIYGKIGILGKVLFDDDNDKRQREQTTVFISNLQNSQQENKNRIENIEKSAKLSDVLSMLPKGLADMDISKAENYPLEKMISLECDYEIKNIFVRFNNQCNNLNIKYNINFMRFSHLPMDWQAGKILDAVGCTPMKPLSNLSLTSGLCNHTNH